MPTELQILVETFLEGYRLRCHFQLFHCKILLKLYIKYWTHHHAKRENDVSVFLFGVGVMRPFLTGGLQIVRFFAKKALQKGKSMIQ